MIPPFLFISSIVFATHVATSSLVGFCHHPIVPCLSDTILEWFVEADIDRLAEGGAANRDVLHLNPELLDPLDNGSHHMGVIAVQDEEWNNVVQRRCDIRHKGLINTRQHYRFIHPGIFLAAIMVGCWVGRKLRPRDPSVWCPLKNNH